MNKTIPNFESDLQKSTTEKSSQGVPQAMSILSPQFGGKPDHSEKNFE